MGIESAPTVSHCDIGGGLPFQAIDGGGNFNADPLFADALSGNFHLMAASPCINAGNNGAVTGATDLDGGPRIVLGTVDMGAYEATPVSTIEGLHARVEALVAGGVILPADGQSLYAKLDAARDKVNGGDNGGAIGSLSAFVNQVQAFIRTHKLTPAQGQPLIDSANVLIAFFRG
jgi:hypothetical protein